MRINGQCTEGVCDHCGKDHKPNPYTCATCGVIQRLYSNTPNTCRRCGKTIDTDDGTKYDT